MSILDEMYLQQIARARQQYPSVGQRPINAGPNLEQVNNSAAAGFASGLGKGALEVFNKGYIEPRVNAQAKEYAMQNDPEVQVNMMNMAYETYSKLAPEMQEKLKGTPGHQVQLRKWKASVPGAPIIEDATGLQFAQQQPSEGSQRLALDKEKFEQEKQMIPLEISAKKAYINYLNRDKGSSSSENSAYQKYEKQTLDAYDKLMMQSQKIMDERTKMGGTSPLNTRMEVVNTKTDATINLLRALGQEHPRAIAEAGNRISELYDNYTRAILPERDKRWLTGKGAITGNIPLVSSGMRAIRSTYTEEQSKIMQDITSRGFELAMAAGGNLDQMSSQKLIWMKIMADPETPAEIKNRLRTWRDVTPDDAKIVLGGQ